MMSIITVEDSINSYLDSVYLSRSINTWRTYRNAMNSFRNVLLQHHVDPENTAIETLQENAVSWFSTSLKRLSPATERLYLTACVGFYEYISAESLSSPNIPRVKMLVRQRARRFGQRLPQFPRESIDEIIAYAKSTNYLHDFCSNNNTAEVLRHLRDKAFLITLAETGLRVHEACHLRRGDIDWNENKALIIGKGNRQDIVRFSEDSIDSIRNYLTRRSVLDGASHKPLSSLPIFARHDKGAGKKVLPITTTTGRNIVKHWVKVILGEDATGTITPHSFRHYFVTTVLRGSGGQLKLAQELARHRNIAVTQRYAHLSDDELDRGYWDIFDDA